MSWVYPTEAGYKRQLQTLKRYMQCTQNQTLKNNDARSLLDFNMGTVSPLGFMFGAPQHVAA